jgi:3-hydroxyisobutyrate dehydrogenase-like beta-hydroxyacid dehydrogenase
MHKIAWIGTGVMGSSMVKNLAKQNQDISVYNKTYFKAKAVADEAGLKVAATINEAVKDAEYIFLMVGYPQDVEEVFYAQGGLLDSAKKNSLIIDMSTSSPTLAQKLYHEAGKKGLRVLDAPVSGGDSGARNATLSIMVGGDEADFNEAKVLFEAMGKNINYMGSPGNGQHTKASNQIAVAGATAAMTEAIVYAKNVGLDPQKMLLAIGGGAAGSWQISNMAPRVLKEDFAPGFFVKHFIKDMNIIDAEMKDRGIELRMLESVLGLYREMAKEGNENDGTQALIKLYM